MKNLKETLTAAGINTALTYLETDPDKNLPKALAWIDRLDPYDKIKPQRDAFRKYINDKDRNWYKLIISVINDIDMDVLKSFFTNFFISSVVIGGKRREEVMEKYNCNVPWAILMDPTSACNLKCTGCWAAEYGHKMNMSFETLDSIVTQGKELGTYMYIFSGGEPLVRKDDVIKLCDKHNECQFLSFTNGTLIDEDFADEMLRIKNFIPAISIEGFEEATDARRGDGTYQAVTKAMEILKRKKLPFGVSCCYTSQNYQVIGSDEYYDDLIAKGAKFAWFFTYIPVGVDAVPDLMVTPEQRKFMYDKIREFRGTKALFTMDFWNDGEYVNGCIAGGRKYLHINANGDIEPCAFIHYSNCNIHNSTLLEALQSPLFMQYKQNQPFNKNLLRPCPLLDNPEKLMEMVDKSDAHSTEMANPEDVHQLCGKCVDAAAKWTPTADILWDATIDKKPRLKY